MRIVWSLNVIVGIAVFIGVYTRVHADKTYVLTPFLEVVPEGTEWTPAEMEQLQQHLPNMLEARDMDRGYAHLGSTLNIDDVIQGIDGLEMSDVPLSDAQQAQVHSTVRQFLEEHQQIRTVQHDLLEIEGRIRQNLESLEGVQ